MNTTVSLDKRQYGNFFWRDYDISIQRLQCLKLDEYQGISPISEGSNFNSEPPILACKFAEAPRFQHIVALANEDGNIAIQNTSHRPQLADWTPLVGTVAHYNAIFDLAWKTNDMKLVTASGDHTVRLWDISEAGIQRERTFNGHLRSVKTVVFKNNDPAIFASGARDGMIYIWDTRTALHNLNLNPKPDNIINCSCGPHTPGSKSKKKNSMRSCCSRTNSITGLVFQDDITLISCTAGDGIIKMWDLRKSYTTHKRVPQPKYTIPYAGFTTRMGYTNLLVDKNAVRLYASCLDNVIYCFNISTYTKDPVMTYNGHDIQNSFYVKTSLSADDRYLISGSSDEKAYIWNLKQSDPIIKLNGHNAEVTCVAWCQTGDLKVITCSDDSKHKIWRVGCEQDHLNSDEIIGKAEISTMNGKQMPVHSKFMKRMNEGTPNMNSPPKRGRLDSVTPGSSQNKRSAQNDLTSATISKRARCLFRAGPSSCSDNSRTLEPIYEQNVTFECKMRLESETTTKEPSPKALINDLPNFVVDGTAPHLRIISPQKRKENKNWISQYRKEMEIRQRMINETESEPSSPKLPRLDCSPSGRTSDRGKTPKRTPGRTNSNNELKNCLKNESHRRAHSPLLKYFKVTASILNTPPIDQQCSSSLQSSKPTISNNYEDL